MRLAAKSNLKHLKHLKATIRKQERRQSVEMIDETDPERYEREEEQDQEQEKVNVKESQQQISAFHYSILEDRVHALDENNYLCMIGPDESAILRGKYKIAAINCRLAFLGYLVCPCEGLLTFHNNENNNLVPLKAFPPGDTNALKDAEKTLGLLTSNKDVIARHLKAIEDLMEPVEADEIQSKQFLFLVSFGVLKSEKGKLSTKKQQSQIQRIQERIRIVINEGEIDSEFTTKGFVHINRELEAFSSYFCRISSGANSKIVLVGERNSGKSTSSIYLLNKLLAHNKGRVHFLDTDLGQSSFYVPGTVSLFSFDRPELSNLGQPLIKTPTLSFFVGEYSPLNFIEQYLYAVSSAISFFDSFIKNEPLIISMHGFITNLGENLLYDLLKIVRASHIVFLDKSDSRHLDQLKTNIERKFHLRRASLLGQEMNDSISYRNQTEMSKIPPEILLVQNEFKVNLQATNETKRLRKDEMLAAYFLKNEDSNAESSAAIDFQGPFARMCLIKPYEIKYDDFVFLLRKANSNELFYPNDFERFALTFVNSVVAMFSETDKNKSKDPRILEQVPLQDVCLGFAYIKDANLTTRTVYVITPEEEKTLERVLLMAKSTEVNFSSGFYSKQMKDLIQMKDLLYDMNGVFDPENKKLVPAYFVDIADTVGSEPYRNKISIRRKDSGK